MSEETPVPATEPNANRRELVERLGTELRALRKERQLTLEALGKRAGVSIGLLSQIERGNGNPSFNTLADLAHALEVPIGRLLHNSDIPSPVVRAGERRTLDLHERESQAVHHLLTPSLRGPLEALWVEVPPGSDAIDGPFVHEGVEFGIILQGTHEVTVGNQVYVLEAGDSITFQSTVPHSYRNVGDDRVVAVWVVTPPTF
ncbi:DNA-binding protein [Acrocarpospora phusangensis]|uniref:DNA-binding protein n=1 Tax=Acrocarpospora phusangensis TaxID=1070424 RepID=A0A919UIT1_9ACTN|nr:XRE family transcriptional regulator [Acrocarpospora phusangensis]GIH23404.1 DNA-binding protein [Acrocarpospora phusangensis]